MPVLDFNVIDQICVGLQRIIAAQSEAGSYDFESKKAATCWMLIPELHLATLQLQYREMLLSWEIILLNALF